jgi:hypothetical protein
MWGINVFIMQIDYVKISCKEDVHICCTNFAKQMERNLHETTSWWKTYEKRLFSEDLEVRNASFCHWSLWPCLLPHPTFMYHSIKYIHRDDTCPYNLTSSTTSQTSRSSENDRFSYFFHQLVVSYKFCSIFFAKFV